MHLVNVVSKGSPSSVDGQCSELNGCDIGMQAARVDDSESKNEGEEERRVTATCRAEDNSGWAGCSDGADEIDNINKHNDYHDDGFNNNNMEGRDVGTSDVEDKDSDSSCDINLSVTVRSYYQSLCRKIPRPRRMLSAAPRVHA